MNLECPHYDLVTPDGSIQSITHTPEGQCEATVEIHDIRSSFVGYEIDRKRTFFNLKSTLAQVGLNCKTLEVEFDAKTGHALARLQLTALGKIARQLLPMLEPGMKIGKLFAADDRRRVRDPHYLSRMFGRSDRWKRPLLSLGGLHGSSDLLLEKIDGRTIAFLSLLPGQVRYEEGIYGLLATIVKALKTDRSLRGLVGLHQRLEEGATRNVSEGELLLVKTPPLHIRTVFAHVVDELLPPGYKHTSASVLQPDTLNSGDIYELYGSSEQELVDIPLEFYTLEPYREFVFYADRDQLQTSIEDPQTLFNAFDTAPGPLAHKAATFVVKGEQLLKLSPQDWVMTAPHTIAFPGMAQGPRQALMVERYISQQACYPFLKAIDDGVITSQGVLFTRYFPTPLIKRLLLADQVARTMKGIYFQYPSLEYDNFFSHEDRALLHDLHEVSIPIYWVDKQSRQVLRYVERAEKGAGMFVPTDSVERFLTSTFFGIYGSNLLAGDFESELRELMQGVLELRNDVQHHMLMPDTKLAMVTGGGPGAMEVGNRVAKELGILSCANVVDFRSRDGAVVNEQLQNPYVEAKMTYRLDKLVERQAEFHLDFPIFLMGGIGTDFEYSLEEVRRKTGSIEPTPLILFGHPDYWRDKITSRFKRNRESGTISGSEWLSNCFYCITNARQGLEVYRRFFSGSLEIGKDGPVFDDGFVDVATEFACV